VQKYGYRANEALTSEAKDVFRCEICQEYAGFNWSDYSGEAMCNRCGTPYQLIDREIPKEELPKRKIKPEWIPVLKRYWEETHEYTGLGNISISPGAYPECVKGRRLFNEWLDEHPDLIPGGTGG